MIQRKILIVGAGIGGLGAAAALADAGHEVEVVEIKPEPNVFGVGINQPANSLRALQRIGVLDEVLEVGFQFKSWVFYDADGNALVEADSQLGGNGIPANNGLSRRDLHSILIGAADRAGATVRYGTTVDELSDNGVAHVGFTDGTSGDYDLVVGFDGINSQLRKRMFPEASDPAYTGYAVWRVTIPRPEGLEKGGMYHAVGAKAGYIPLSQETMYLLLVVPEPENVRYDKADFPNMLRERLAPFKGEIGRIRDELKDDDDIVYSPLREVLLPTPWFKGRVLICGDAAHASTPHMTQGAAMALEDAVVLADELAVDRDLTESLVAFGERRFPRVKLVQEVSHVILMAEMSFTEDTIGAALDHMRTDLPGRMGGIDKMLDAPA